MCLRRIRSGHICSHSIRGRQASRDDVYICAHMCSLLLHILKLHERED